MQKKILCKEVNQMDMVSYLEKLGYKPTKIKGNDYWYLSPLRDEKTASFKINRQKNVWYDHGSGKGGSLVDFGKLYYQCTVKELLSKLGNERGINFSFHPQKNTIAGEKKEHSDLSGKITIIGSTEITDPVLCNYLKSRQIPLEIATRYCQQVDFELNGKKHLAIGFKNESGGYELRNQYFKGSSTPKQPRLILQNDSNDLAVFEGFFSFLSYKSLEHVKYPHSTVLPTLQTNNLVLNSIAFFEKNRELMEKHEHIHLFLDNDKMGKDCTQKALQWSLKYKDQSNYYGNSKDLNEFLIQSKKQELKQSRGQGMTH